MSEYCRILIVEDELLLRQGIKNLINWEEEGFQIVGEASNGADAITCIEQMHPHIVITDIVMPVMNEIELTGIIHERYPEIQVVVLSSYSDFEYIKSAMKNGADDYLLKPTMNPETLLEAVKKAASKIDQIFQKGKAHDAVPEQVVQKLMSGFPTRKNVTEIKALFPNRHFLLIGTDLVYISGSAEILQRQTNLLQDLSSQYLDANIYCVITVIERKNIMLLLNYPEEMLKKTLSDLGILFSKLANYFPNLFYAATPPFTDIMALKEIYQNQWKYAISQYFYDSSLHFYFHGANDKSIQEHRFDAEQYAAFLKAMRLKDAFSYLLQYTEVVLQNKEQQEYEIKSLLQNAVYQLIAVLEDSDLNEESLSHLKQQYFMRIGHAKSAGELMDFMHMVMEDISAIEAKYHLSPEMAMIHEILDYISAHYADSLTLKSLAEAFNFNYFYLSKYFSAHCNEGFNEYLNRVRVEKACEILLQEHLPISEVCGAVGYMDHSYFTKVFKKFTGCTPKQYRVRAERKSGRS